MNERTVGGSLLLAVVASAAVAAAAGCSSSSSGPLIPQGGSSSGGSSSGSGGASSSSSSGTSSGAGNMLSTDALGDAIYILGTDVQNLAVGGTTCGGFNMTVNCPTGGTATISGNSQNCPTAGGSSTEHDMYTFTMTNCEDVANGIDVTLTGTVTRTSDDTYVSGQDVMEVTNWQATADVTIKGTESGYTDFTQSCTFGMTYNMSSTSKVLTGTLCGTSFTDMF